MWAPVLRIEPCAGRGDSSGAPKPRDVRSADTRPCKGGQRTIGECRESTSMRAAPASVRAVADGPATVGTTMPRSPGGAQVLDGWRSPAGAGPRGVEVVGGCRTPGGGVPGRTTRAGETEGCEVHVLLTNDDGIAAPWLATLVAGFAAAGHTTTVLAPATDQSGASGALAPLPMRGEVDLELLPAPDMPADNAWAVVGATPTVCVSIGLSAGVIGPVDLVVSGPNHGWNIGRDVWRSGTAWAAITGWGLGVPALAVSAAPQHHTEEDLAALVAGVQVVADDLLSREVPEVWNLNFPAPPSASWQAVTSTGLAPGERLAGLAVRTATPTAGGGLRLRIVVPPDVRIPAVQGSDAESVYRGEVALSRLRPVDAWPPADPAAAVGLSTAAPDGVAPVAPHPPQAERSVS